jgi:hypothetical protein
VKSTPIMLSAPAALVMAWSVPSFAEKVVQPGPGGQGGWQLIGRTQADHGQDHNSIVVKGPFDSFRKVKFKVTDVPLNMQRMVVTYDNGEPERLNVAENIHQGGESRAIELRGIGKRHVRRIDFWYDTKGWLKGKADVTVFGLK